MGQRICRWWWGQTQSENLRRNGSSDESEDDDVRHAEHQNSDLRIFGDFIAAPTTSDAHHQRRRRHRVLGPRVPGKWLTVPRDGDCFYSCIGRARQALRGTGDVETGTVLCGFKDATSRKIPTEDIKVLRGFVAGHCGDG